MKETIPDYLINYAKEYGDEVALRRKYHGVWEELTWEEYLGRVKTMFYGLHDLFGDLDRLAMMTNPRVEYLFTGIGAQALNAVPYFTFPENWNLDELIHIFNTIGPEIYIVEDQEQLDKLLEIRDEIPEFEEIIILNHYEVRKYDEDFLSFTEVIERGEELKEEEPEMFDEHVKEVRPDDLASFNRTSGTTGPPKIVEIRHRDFLERAEQTLKRYPISAGDDLFSFLPTGWIGEQLFTFGLAFGARAVVNFPEKNETEMVRRNLREISPAVVFAGPAFWEAILAGIQTELLDSTGIKSWFAEKFLEIGRRMADTPSEDLSIKDKILKFLGEIFVYRKLRDHIGLIDTKYAFTGGATLGPDAVREFRALGLNFLQVYGQSEMAGLTCTHTSFSDDIRSVGKPVEGLDFRISDKGEVHIGKESGEKPFAGYYRNPKANEELFTDDDYFKTGDHGYFNEQGELVMIDRMDHLITLTDGSVFSPRYIEDALRYSPFISEAMAIGDERDYVTVIAEIDWDSVSWWAEDKNIPFTTYKDLTGKDEVVELVRGEIRRVNDDLPEKGKVQKFMLFDKMLDHEDKELTQTGKLRRDTLEEEYSHWIEAMYDGEEYRDLPVYEV